MNLEQLLEQAESGSPRETFFAKLAEDAPKDETETEKVATTNTANTPNQDNENEEQFMKKVAQEIDQQARISARAFYDELQKIAVEAQNIDTPHPASISDNPAVEMPKDMPGATPGTDITARVAAILNGLKGPVQQGVPVIDQNGSPVDLPPQMPVDQSQPIAYDANNAGAKTAGDRIIEALWNLHVTEEGM